ncbi:hypothetical protein B0H11DRAFT_2024308 [Mycena galericulata]|nr:hypothetical protein B0H11DRAFT_2024308 [Mycena galericulata]
MSNRGSTRQAAKRASTKFEEQLMSSPVKSPVRPVSPAKPKRAKSRPNLKSQVTSSSKHTRPMTVIPKRALSLDSRRSDVDGESDLTSLSTPSPTPKPKSLHWLPDTEFSAQYVWVLLDLLGRVVSLDNQDDGVVGIWWPGIVVPKGSKWQVKLFGRIGALKDNSVVELDAPHAGNIASISTASDEIRFTAPEYVTTTSESPKKRQKLDRSDLEAQWHAALSAVVKHILKYELPGTMFLSSVSRIKTDVDEVEEGVNEEPEPEPSTARWSPPLPDASLSIPGELVLAREKKHSTLYWPAKILEYCPPTKPTAERRYLVHWVDNTKTDVPRDFFFVYEDEGFGTCRIGAFESVYQEVVNDDEEGAKDDDDAEAQAAQGRRSPEPRNPPPSAKEFEDLSVHEQFVYTKPVLQAILRDEYQPAREAHEMFIGGGKGRIRVVKEAGERGLMDPKDVEQFQRCLVEWCLRKSVVGKRDEDTEAGEGAEVGEASEQLHTDEMETEEHEVQEPKPVDQVVGVEVTQTEKASQMTEAEGRDLELGDSPAVETNTTSATGEGAASANESDDPMGDVESAEDPALLETLCVPPSPSTTVRDEAPSSPAPPPPSSSFTSTSESDVPMEVEETDTGVPAVEDAFDTSSTLTDASDVSDLISPPKSPRQIGCPAYERLSTLEKNDYCLNVLLPQLIIQILLWRTGKRRSVALLSPKREKELNRQGQEERRKTDWVFDVKRLRAQKEKELARSETVVGGTASRPKKGRR